MILIPIALREYQNKQNNLPGFANIVEWYEAEMFSRPLTADRHGFFPHAIRHPDGRWLLWSIVHRRYRIAPGRDTVTAG